MIWIIAILLSFISTFYLIPQWIKKAKKSNIVGKDLHKLYKKPIPEAGGITVIGGFLIGIFTFIILNEYFNKIELEIKVLFGLIIGVLIAALIGFIDDTLGWKKGLRQIHKFFLTFLIGIPLIIIKFNDISLNLPIIGNLNIDITYILILVILGIVFTSNSFNTIAGYNGLEAGMGIIILSTIAVIAYMENNTTITITTLCLILPLIAFLIYNWNPAKIFPGDTLTYSIGAVIGLIIIIANIEKYAVILFSLYIFEFILKARSKFQAESIGKLQKNGSINMPYKKIYGIEHIAILCIKKIKKNAYEKDIVYTLLGSQIIISLVTILYYLK